MTNTSYEKIGVFTVQDNTDHNEGRGREYIKAYTTSESCAKRIAKRAYVQGTDCPIGGAFLYKVGDKYFPTTAEVRLSVPTKEDLERDKFITSLDGIVEKALALGLTEEEINILQSARNLLNK